MELLQYLLLSQLLVTVFGTPIVNGYVYSFGSVPRNLRNLKTCRGCSSNGEFKKFASSPRNKRGQNRRNEIDQAFRELQEELEGMNVEFTGGFDSLNRVISETVDKDTAKKWIDKTFDLASEFNKDFATIPSEQKINEKNLRKTRDLLVSVFDGIYNDEDLPEVTEDDMKQSPDQTDDPPINPDIGSVPKKPVESVTETPKLENRSNDKKFLVAIDLPGVNRADVEISAEDNLLVLSAKRDTESDDSRVRIYTTKIALPENQIDVEKLDATMKNGVLVITAPKHKPSKKRRNIPIS